ncbi:MAG TPA: glycoside hydrolase family 2 TIM barrel-domain containing protein [Micromonosporaceae bacterium]|nr:glycoside hydrolase family 2 TIM barrel-domain containing protein [Micromonosporaceae bacterium]
MEINRRQVLAIGAAGAGAAGLSALGLAAARPADAALVGPVTESLLLTGADADNTVNWEFQVTSGRRAGVWSTIPTPSNWEFHGFGTFNYGWNLVPGERGMYRRTFTPSTAWAGRRIFLVFEGSMTDTEVRVNGTSAGPRHQGGFYRFRYDVTGLVRLGESNLIEVTVSKESADNSVNDAERRGDYWNFGGIYRPVYLEAFPAARIDRVAINAQASGAFAADVYLAGVSAAGRVVGQIRRLDGTAVGGPFQVNVAAGATRVTLNTTASAPLQWTAETPNLYQVEFQLANGAGAPLHSVAQRFGFRTIEVRNGSGVYVNGRRVILKGSNRHTIWPTLGRASSPRLARLDIQLMKDMNHNAVRMSHYPPDQFFLDLCDEIGLYVIDELAGWQKRYDEGVAAPLVASMVTRDVNHPSILMWANGNEGGWNTALDDDYARYDPQNRRVIHPWANFNGINTDHYETYESTRSILAGSTIHMPTEFLHGLYDGGAGAGLNDYWNLLGTAPRSAGGFIWAFVDEGVARPDRGGVIDTAGNAGADGILGPYREKEASFYTVRDIWSPVQLSNPSYYATSFPTNFTSSINVINRYDFTNLRDCRFAWQLVNFPAPGAADTAPTVVAQGTVAGPDVAPGAAGIVVLGLPATWASADALRVTTIDPTGREINNWAWTIRKAAGHASRIVVPAAGSVAVAETSSTITMTAGALQVAIARSTGRLAGVTRSGVAVSLTNGPAPADGSATLTRLTHFRDGTGYVVQADYTGAVSSVRWRLDSNGWLQMEYRYTRTGNHNYFGVSMSYPESRVRGLTWLGDGPYRVYKNRRRGVTPGVWSKTYNNTATGGSFVYPEFKGYHANTYWAALRTDQGIITMVAAQENLFLRLFTPAVASNPMSATTVYPGQDISFLDAIPAIGNKFHTATQLGPESQLNVAAGEYRRSIYFRFTA